VFIHNLRLQNFRNYAEAQFSFNKKAIGLFGKNGSGKTNILDAIHYLSFSKSVLNNQDSQNVKHGESYFLIEGEFGKQGHRHSVRCVFDGKKKLLEDGQEYNRFSEHIGKYPIIMIIPQDINLIWEGGEGRRRFFDLWLSQADKQYLEKLVEYNHLLKQRNGLLKEAQSSGRVDRDLIDSYNDQLAPASKYIYQTRKKFIEEINPELQKEYAGLVRSGEVVTVKYFSDLDLKSTQDIFLENLEKEMAAGRTIAGVHLDEYQFLLNDFEVRKYGSQGQQKSFLIGLKLVELAYFSKKRGFSPLLLLDDIFDKMDDDRISRLMELLNQGKIEQLFITDANPDRARQIFKNANLDFQEFNIDKGEVVAHS
jgi:DNA replication and repair protein RecF